MGYEVLVPMVVMVPLLGAALALVFSRRLRVQAAITGGALLAVAIIGAVLMWQVDVNGTVVMAVGGWQAPVGIVLMVDRVSALLLTVSAVVLFAVLVFSMGQRLADGDEEAPVSIFYPCYLVLGAGVFDAFIANDLFNLYVAFEILLVASYVLLTMGGTAARIRAGVTYIVVSLVSSILFLTAIAMIYGATGTVSMAQLSSRVADLDPGMQLILNLTLLIAFGIKAAIFPLSFWLPDSYPTAPAPVTAVFAGLLTKVGIYAILRSQTLIFTDSDINTLLMWIAGITLLVGILGAISQRDVKRLLSFTLISHIGYLLFGVSLNTDLGSAATVYYIVHHIILQTTMFLIVGMMERMSGTTSLDGLGGLARKAPLLAALAFVTAINLGGIPPFSGFIGKIGLLSAAVEDPNPQKYIIIGVGTLVSLLTLHVLIRMWSISFWRPKNKENELLVPGSILDRLVQAPNPEIARESRSVPALMTASAVGMVAITLLLTVFAGPLVAYAERAGKVLQDPAAQVDWYFQQHEVKEMP
ncbi:Na+/H+ antiporter subunit D [Canibacter zhuwentaonis]|uniref:Na+/H+ antiporter subunit D n=1 Tax=Canibacter zhuwentaonis TaxID=2837491 RepID=UPI003D701D4F